MALTELPVIHRLSASAVIDSAPRAPAGSAYSVVLPAVVILPTVPLDPFVVVYQRLPSGPAAMPLSPVAVMWYSVIAPVGVILPITPRVSVNQQLPSGP